MGDADQQADRTHATAAQAFGHPQGRGLRGIHTFNNPAQVARRIGACAQFDGQRGVMQRRHRHVVERLDLATGGGGDIERDPADAEAVGAVRGQLQFDAGIRQAQIIGQRRADRRIRGQFQQAGGIGIDAEFLGRTQHAVGVDATQRCRADRQLANAGADHGQWRDQTRARVRRTADDLEQLLATAIDLADLQFVGLRMPGALHDARDDNTIQRRAEHGQLFDLQTDRGQRRGEFIARGRRLDVLAQPVFGKFHANCPKNRTSFSKKLRRSSTP